MNYKLFYCQGGFSYEKMNLPSRLAMKFFVKMLKSQKNKTPADEAKIKMISSSFDASDFAGCISLAKVALEG